MKLFGLFTEFAPNRIFLSILSGGVAGVAYVFLIPLLLNSVAPKDERVNYVDGDGASFFFIDVSQPNMAAVYFLLCFLIVLLRSYSQVTLATVAIELATNLRQHIYGLLGHTSISKIEKIGPSRLIASISNDVDKIVGGARLLPEILVNLITITGMMLFLFYLDDDIFWFVIKGVIFGVVTFKLLVRKGASYFRKSRGILDDLHQSIRALVSGAKELKLNRAKRQDFEQEHLIKHEYGIRENDKKGSVIIEIASIYGELINFLVIGSVTFIFVSYHNVEPEHLIGVIMVLLYIISPLSMLMNSLPTIAVANVCLERIRNLSDQLESENLATEIKPIKAWTHIRLKDVTYQYDVLPEQGNIFAVGPIDLTINKGEITTIIGGNGSGKSTLAKLLTLHYLPSGGTIYWGDQEANEFTVNSFRQGIAVIYSDYFLFNEVLGVDPEVAKTSVPIYLKELGLEDKVTFENGKFSTLSLSDGQRRRLALIAALLEDKELYLFDEWAADQDPEFKHIFYTKLLPDLKARNKAVVVISHDDRYFNLSDRLIKLENGKLKEQFSPSMKARDEEILRLV